MSEPTILAPRLLKALEGSMSALRQLAESELPEPVAMRMRLLGERKDALEAAERDEYLALVNFWKSRTLEKAEAAVALHRLREAVPDLVATP